MSTNKEVYTVILYVYTKLHRVDDAQSQIKAKGSHASLFTKNIVVKMTIFAWIFSMTVD